MYFPLNVNFFDDAPIELVEAKCGLAGITAVIKLLCKMYKENGYYLLWDKEQCTLSKKEAELLAALMENAGQTLSRSFLFGRVWGPGADVEEASLDSYVHFIRRRLRAVSSRVTVDTVRGVGYRLLDGGTGA